MNPLISIIINCYNGEEFLEDSLKSIYSQTYKNWEVVFFDNASTDSTAEIVQKFDSKIRYFKNEKTIPLYAARKKAVDLCNGSYVCFLDSDDLWSSDCLDLLLSSIVDDYVLSYGAFSLINEKGEHIDSPSLCLTRGSVTNKLLLRNFVSVSCILIKSEVIKENNFNSKWSLIGDYDLWLRISEKYKFNYVEKVIQYSRQHSNNATKTMKERWISERRELYKEFIARNGLMSYPAVLYYILRVEVKAFFNQKL